MNAELEALILAREAMLEARSGEAAKRLRDLYQSPLGSVLQRCPDLPCQKLVQLVENDHWRW